MMMRIHPLFLSFFVAMAIPHVTNAMDDEQYVTCGSAVKLQHRDTGFYLNSEPKNLNAGSGQQIVTFVADPATHNTLWSLRPAHHGQDGEYPVHYDELTCRLADPIRCGVAIRLTHLDTRRNLHSHGVESVLSHQQEVTAYGTGDGQGDGGDNWRVECETEYWEKGESVRLFHIDTQKYLGAAKQLEFNRDTCGMQCPIMNHLEAFCRKSKDGYSALRVEQGIHIYK